jgi:phosphoribosylanthranilate isomerase
MTRIKFCGLTREEDIEIASELAVDAVGFVLWPKSPRAMTLDGTAALVKKLPASITPVGVFVRPTAEEIAEAANVAGIQVAQVHGVDDPAGLLGGPCDVWAALALSGSTLAIPGNMTMLLDAQDDENFGGTGRTIDWHAARQIAAIRRVMLAGGLTPDNVGKAIAIVRPYGVDVSSGIEERPGVKHTKLMRDFARAVRIADVQVRDHQVRAKQP